MRAGVCVLLVASTALLARGDNQDEIAKHAQDLRSKDALVRLKAADKLATFGEAATVPLCDAMTGEDVRVSEAALKGLKKANPKLYEPLNRLVTKTDAANQLGALKALGDLGKSGEPTVKLLGARYANLGVGYVGGMKAGGPWTAAQMKDVQAAYRNTIKTLSGERELVEVHKSIASKPGGHSQMALQWLVTWAGDKEERRKELLPVLKENLSGRTPSMEHIRLAGSYGPLTKDLVPDLKKLDRSTSETMRQAAQDAIKKIEAP